MRTPTMSWKILFEVSTGYRSSPPSARKRSAAPTRSLVRRVNHAHRSPRSSTRNEAPVAVYPIIHGDPIHRWALAEGRAGGAPQSIVRPLIPFYRPRLPRFQLARQPFASPYRADLRGLLESFLRRPIGGPDPLVDGAPCVASRCPP